MTVTNDKAKSNDSLLNKVLSGKIILYKIVDTMDANNLFTGIMLAAIYYFIGGNSIKEKNTYTILYIISISWVLQVGIRIFFKNVRNVYKYQKNVITWSVIAMFEFSIITYYMLNIIATNSAYSSNILYLTIFAIIIGILLMGVSIIIILNNIKKEKIKRKSTKTYKPLTGLSFLGVSIAGIIAKQSISINGIDIGFVFMFICAIIMQYIIMIFLAPQNVLLLYCKFRYKEFVIEMPIELKNSLEREEQEKKGKKRRFRL